MATVLTPSWAAAGLAAPLALALAFGLAPEEEDLEPDDLAFVLGAASEVLTCLY